ncbi:pyruvate kinase [Legionella israelensis]|uniref:Pyruvate kinase n=1 Tax=Legionella israelensis TaxID=454 RepID=A0A0W0VKJ3_9GAMM|nr:pyruvate kinase [Legionella israelensis]KTD20604.1 pyruvate kinase II [Legionella israelensis]QBS09821.1 pyruvate kinase [Legionella israelensis]SCY13246.1 pyruvate kinase [Legionella israelensis DSM 19235]STX59373.1 pyruvate kinase [Legionella israelensis]
MLRRTKIIATVGPSSASESILREMLSAGVDVLRINFSHASESALGLIQSARKIAKELKHPLAVMADLQGPKIRIGRFKHQSVTLVNGQKFTLNCQNKHLLGDSKQVFVTYPDLCQEVNIGDRLLLSDGLIELEVESVQQTEVHCRVIDGGVLSDLKGLNRKGGGLAARTLTDKDKADMEIAVNAKVDYLGLSFVKDAQDIRHARELLCQLQAEPTLIIAKIERSEALEHLNEIIQEADAIMVARGDLGVEIGAAEVPAIQKRIISQTRQMDKVVITATQMMESMIHSPQPTRAEASDVANAILDGTDAVMLSAETATGEYPVKVIQMVDKICMSAEKHAEFLYQANMDSFHYQSTDHAIAMAAMYTANHFPVNAIIALTESGATAVWMSRLQSAIPIFAITANERTVARLSLVNNVFPIYLDFRSFKLAQLNQDVIQYLVESGRLKKDSQVLVTRGTTIGKSGGTNCMEIMSV